MKCAISESGQVFFCYAVLLLLGGGFWCCVCFTFCLFGGYLVDLAVGTARIMKQRK